MQIINNLFLRLLWTSLANRWNMDLAEYWDIEDKENTEITGSWKPIFL